MKSFHSQVHFAQITDGTIRLEHYTISKKITGISPYQLNVCQYAFFCSTFSNFYYHSHTHCCYRQRSSELNIVATILGRTVGCQFGDRKSLRSGSTGAYSFNALSSRQWRCGGTFVDNALRLVSVICSRRRRRSPLRRGFVADRVRLIYGTDLSSLCRTCATAGTVPAVGVLRNDAVYSGIAMMKRCAHVTDRTQSGRRQRDRTNGFHGT